MALKDGRFTVKSLYDVLEGGDRLPFLYFMIWKAPVPPKVTFFVWEASWEKAMTMDNVKRKDFSLAN